MITMGPKNSDNDLFLANIKKSIYNSTADAIINFNLAGLDYNEKVMMDIIKYNINIYFTPGIKSCSKIKITSIVSFIAIFMYNNNSITPVLDNNLISLSEEILEKLESDYEEFIDTSLGMFTASFFKCTC